MSVRQLKIIVKSKGLYENNFIVSETIWANIQKCICSRKCKVFNVEIYVLLSFDICFEVLNLNLEFCT